ncbi:glycosyltransferase family 2 protein [Numidum massiliense]|uniref:glycosyltransferase family 2 protein n=1 Tax=Numidum massiliense TaxID=1522315 RepID=UPI0006D532B4|nr:glycosyltransferase family 2 protein [Numidum massiliense]
MVRTLVSIVILTHNEWKYTSLCLRSLQQHTDAAHEVIVVDNGSTDESLAHLRQLRDRGRIRLLENDVNRGFAAGVNCGMDAAKGTYIALLNNDTVPSHRWLDNQLQLLQQREGAGIVGPLSNRVLKRQKLRTDLTSLSEIHRFSQQHNRPDPAKWRKTPLLSGFCMVLTQELVRSIGLFDERFGAGTYEDNDYCRRALGAGFTCWIAGDTYVHHFGNKSFSRRGRAEFQKILRQNRQYYSYKWRRK